MFAMCSIYLSPAVNASTGARIPLSPEGDSPLREFNGARFALLHRLPTLLRHGNSSAT